MDISNLINNQEKLNAMTLRELKNTIDRFPFYHAARLLYIINLYNMHEPNLSEELTKASVLIPDRATLFNLIEGHNYKLDNFKDKRVDTENDENRTVSLIDNFLSSIPDDNKNDKNNRPHSVPTIADLTNDYAAFLQMKDNDMNVKHENNGQDSLIDSFIQENKGKQRFDLNNEDPTGPDNINNDDLDTLYNENIVNIYIKQGRYQQALEILKSICLNNPEKNTIFATQMRLLETIVNNNKQ